MPDQQEHVLAAETNETIARALLDISPTWSVVLTFYAALHWVDAFLAKLPLHPRDHTERDHYVSFDPLRPIYPKYRKLSTRSREARYDLRDFTRGEAESYISAELNEIRTHLTPLL